MHSKLKYQAEVSLKPTTTNKIFIYPHVMEYESVVYDVNLTFIYDARQGCFKRESKWEWRGKDITIWNVSVDRSLTLYAYQNGHNFLLTSIHT